MLTRDERDWWPWLPVLAAQGLWVRARTERLPPAGSPRGATGQGSRRLRLLGLGDSIIAGIGVTDQREGLLGQTALQLAQRSAATVEWIALGAGGRAAVDIDAALLAAARAEEPDLVVLSLGVNDAVQGVAGARFKEALMAVVDGLKSGRRAPAIVFAGVPPLEVFPALPRPLATLLGRRAVAIAAAAESLAGYRGLKVVVMPRSLARQGFARDGFHPGPAACAVWAGWVADGFTLALE